MTEYSLDPTAAGHLLNFSAVFIWLLIIWLGIMTLVMPLYVWGCYNQLKHHTQLLRDILAKPTITPRAQTPPIQPARNPPTTRLRH